MGGMPPASLRSLPTVRKALCLLDKGPFLILLEGGLQFPLGIHDDGAPPGDRLTDGLSRYQQKADRPVFGGNGHFVAVSIEDEVFRATDALPLHVE